MRLEVSDAEGIAGVVQAENVGITAEAYDVALDVNFPKHSDSGLDFEVVRVFDERTLTCTLKNKGKYELAFRFFVDRSIAARHIPGYTDDSLSISPLTATLQPLDKPTPVKFVFRTRQELTLASVPVIKCEVIEPQAQETIAVIPISLSVRAVFSKYALLPSRGVNFGAVVLGTAKLTREFIIENHGDFEFRFFVTKQAPPNTKRSSRKSVLGASAGPQGRRSGLASPAGGRPEPERQSTHRITVGCFTVFPGGGTVPVGGSVKVTVEADPQMAGKDEKQLCIDVEQRPEDDNPKGIPYMLSIEPCVPAISREFTTIFCEHAVVPRFAAGVPLTGPTFSVEDGELAYGPVVVGHVATARIRISNPTKVCCPF